MKEDEDEQRKWKIHSHFILHSSTDIYRRMMEATIHHALNFIFIYYFHTIQCYSHFTFLMKIPNHQRQKIGTQLYKYKRFIFALVTLRMLNDSHILLWCSF